MLWNIAAPFFHNPGDDSRWIDDFVPSDRFRFRKVPVPQQAAGSWHNRAGRGTPIAGWQGYWRHAAAGLRDADGLVTVFPQLAAMAGLAALALYTQLPRGMPGDALRAAAGWRRPIPATCCRHRRN